MFVTQARQFAREHSRRNEAYSLIVSPPEGTYPKDHSSAMELMVADIVEGGRRAYPASKVFAVAHADSEGSHGCGGKPHVHLVVMNHDLDSGKAISANRTAPQVRAIYNTLGAELGWDETEVTHERTLHKSTLHGPNVVVDASKDDAELAVTRKRLASLGAYELELFDDVVKAKRTASGKDYAEWQTSFRAELHKDGITMEFARGRRGPHQPKAPTSKAAQGVIYRRRNPATNRMRGMKASSLGPQVSLEVLRQASKDNILEQQRQAQAEAEKAAAAARARQLEADRRAAEAEAKREPVLWWLDGDPLIFVNGAGTYLDEHDVKLEFHRTPNPEDRYSWDLNTQKIDAPEDYLERLERCIDAGLKDGLFAAERAREVADTIRAHQAEQEAREQAEREREQQAKQQRDQVAAEQLAKEQHRAANPTFYGATINGLAWKDAQEWMSMHRDTADKLAERIAADPGNEYTPSRKRVRNRHVEKVNAAGAVYTTTLDQTRDEEQARQALMRHIAEQQVLEAQARAKVNEAPQTGRRVIGQDPLGNDLYADD